MSVSSHHVHEAGVTEQTGQIHSTHPCCLTHTHREINIDYKYRYKDRLITASLQETFFLCSYWTGRFHLLLCDLQVGFVGVVVGVELQSFLIVTGCFCVFVETRQSQTETHTVRHTHRQTQRHRGHVRTTGGCLKHLLTPVALLCDVS